jgi:hypothetical protein
VTLEDVENTLPNGLHDAEVRRVSMDYQERKLTFDLSVWVGDMDDSPERREAYRSAQLVVSDVLFLVMEPPDPSYPFMDTAQLRVDGCEMRKNLDNALLQTLPNDAFVRSLWVNEWNAFIHIAAKNANMVWQDAGIVYREKREHLRPGESIDLK